MMLAGWILLSAFPAVLGIACNPGGPPIRHVGSFENWRFTEEHQYGYGLQVFKQGENLFGLFRFADGHLAGDVPIGILEEVKLDAATGAFSFSSKMSLGMISASEHSRDLFMFSGKMQPTQVEGTVERRNAAGRGSSLGSRRLVLRPAPPEETRANPTSCADWIKLWEPVFEAWGPKW